MDLGHGMRSRVADESDHKLTHH